MSLYNQWDYAQDQKKLKGLEYLRKIEHQKKNIDL